MTTINYEKIFKQYYQIEYDFNTSSLTNDEINQIKKLAREKRVDYALAPMGTEVFGWIQKQSDDIRFELVPFESEKIDGMLYIPATGKARAYIILNSNKPLVNQMFTAAHEFYHYISDYQIFKSKPYICDFTTLNNLSEKKACRFAAELLLPAAALSQEMNDYCRKMDITDGDALNFNHFAVFAILMTVKYQMPLKAVIYRLAEEHYIDNVNKYINNYTFIKRILQDIKIFEKRVSELYSTDNSYIIPYSKTYQDMEKAYITGNASREEIIKDAEFLALDMEIVNEIVSQEELPETEADDDDEIFSIINARRDK